MRIGGDIGGLASLGRTLTGVAPEVDDAAEYLFGKVDALVHDAGWNGEAAESFKGAWDQDGAAVHDLAAVLKTAGDAVTALSGALRRAQNQLDDAVDRAKAKGVRFNDDGPLPGPYSGTALDAAKQFETDSQAANHSADAARAKAGEELHAVLSAINPEVPSDGGVTVADLATLGTALKGYYVAPKGRAGQLRKDLAKAKAAYHDDRTRWKRAAPGSAARTALSSDLREARAGLTAATGDLKAAEALSDKFKGGEFLDASVADTFRALGGGLDAESRLGRALDGVPGLDVALAGLATWAQVKDDHEKGWSWTHAILADGGSNAAALTAGIASDFIPVVGPFVSPVISYGVGAVVTEATHEGHWTRHIDEDGWPLGLLEGAGDTGKAVWENDVVGVGEKVGHDIAHPVDGAKGVWQGVKNLF
jgi:uncharacterized protein YukE